MANTIVRIGTRESPLAVWQAQQVKNYLTANGIRSARLMELAKAAVRWVALGSVAPKPNRR